MKKLLISSNIHVYEEIIGDNERNNMRQTSKKVEKSLRENLNLY